MSLDFNFLIGVLGIVLTIASTVLSIYLFKRKRYPGSITYIEDQSTGLFNALVKNFSEITITYDSKSISQQLALLKGFLINDGSIDINPNMIEQDLTLELPNGFNWLSVKVVDQSMGNKSIMKIISDNKIEVKLGLFRKNEYIAFEALSEVTVKGQEFDSGNALSENLFFSHRIADTDKVKKQNPDLKKARFWNSNIWFLLFMSVGMLAFVFWMLTLKIREIAYSVDIPENHRAIAVYPDVKNDSLVNLVEENGKLYKTVSVKQLNGISIKQLHIGHGRGYNFIGKVIITVIVFFFILGALFFIYIVFSNYIDYKKAVRIKRILNLNSGL